MRSTRSLAFLFAYLCTPAAGLRRDSRRSRAGAEPRPLWTYWGSPTPPALVDLCVTTLRYHAGSDWTVHVLSRDTALDHVSLGDLPPSFSSMRPSFQADALRLALLRRHGGMWIDATTIATRNFSDWVGEAFSAGSNFYGFYIEHYTAQGGPPLVASWAVGVAAPEEPIMVAWHKHYLKLWQNRSTADDITDDKFFSGADISNVDPLMQDYLNVELVLNVLLQRNEQLRQRFDDTATVVSAEMGPYSIQTWMGMKWFGGGPRCRPVTTTMARLPGRLQQQLASTPLVKLRHQDRRYLESMSAAEILGHKNSVLGSLFLNNGAAAPKDSVDGGSC